MFCNQLFREEFGYFFIYILFDYLEQTFYFRAKELCEAVGYRDCRSALRQCFPYKKKLFKEFNLNFAKIPHNSVFIDFQGALHLVNKSKIYILEKSRITFALHEKIRALEKGIIKRATSENFNSENPTVNPSGTETIICNPETASTSNIVTDDISKQAEEFPEILIIKDENSIKNNTSLNELNHNPGDDFCDQEEKIEIDLETLENCETNDDFEHFSENMDFSNTKNNSIIINMLQEILELQRKNLLMYQEVLKKLNLE